MLQIVQVIRCLVARMELLAGFLLHQGSLCYLLPGFHPWISVVQPAFGQYYAGVTSFLPTEGNAGRVLASWSNRLCELNLGLWIHTLNSSSLLWVPWGLLYWSQQDLPREVLLFPGRIPRTAGEWLWDPWEQEEKKSVFQSRTHHSAGGEDAERKKRRGVPAPINSS